MQGTIRWVLTGLVALAVSADSRGDDFPYEAYVIVDEADVVAGPGHRFYVTERLPFGTKVEIYREETSGWLAIRPPEVAFSWVHGDFIERMEDDIGRVKEPAGTWIGTSIEHVSQHQQQVKLKSGELVRILGEKAVAASDGSEYTWLKIAPPAGEYRWIYMRDVSRQKPAERPAESLALEREDEEPSEEPQRFELAGNPIALHSLDEPALRRDKQVRPAQFAAGATSSRAGTLSPDGFVPRKRRDGAAAPLAQLPPSLPRPAPATGQPATPRMASVSTVRPAEIASGPTHSGGISAAEVNKQLDQLEIDLSLMVARDVGQWNLGPLKQRVELLVEQGGDPASRGRARLVLEKIKQFEATFAASSGPAAPRATASAAGLSISDPRYDAQGVLKEVISRKGAKPAAPYAVVDSEGKPLCFVSPSPGLNLNRYLNKPVGLYGRRGYMEELKKPHLLAENVIELDTRLR